MPSQNAQLVETVAAWEQDAIEAFRDLHGEVERLRARNRALEEMAEENEQQLRKQLEQSARGVKALAAELADKRPSADETLRARQEAAELNARLLAREASLAAANKRCEAVEARFSKEMAKKHAVGVAAEELENALNERRAMAMQLQTLSRQHEDTELYKEQTTSYLHRYEKEMQQLQAENKQLRLEIAELHRQVDHDHHEHGHEQ